MIGSVLRVAALLLSACLVVFTVAAWWFGALDAGFRSAVILGLVLIMLRVDWLAFTRHTEHQQLMRRLQDIEDSRDRASRC